MWAGRLPKMWAASGKYVPEGISVKTKILAGLQMVWSLGGLVEPHS